MPIDIGGTPPPASGTFLGGFGALSRMIRRDYDPDRVWRNVGPRRQGSIGGGLRYDHLYDLTYNPMKYTVVSPSHDLAGQLDQPILGIRGASPLRPRKGSFTLDMIDWNANLAQLSGSTLGLDKPLLGRGSVNAEAGDLSGLPSILRDPMTFLDEKDIDLFRNAPARLFDYAFAPLDMALKGLGFTQPDSSGGDEPHVYAFQKDPTYWAFLRDSTAEQRRQMAEFMADRSLDRSRNAYLRDDMLKQMELDFGSFDAMSSGNARFDYLAKRGLQIERDPTMTKTINIGGREHKLVVGSDTPSLWAGVVPLIGTEVAQGAAPISRETEAIWRSLTPGERQTRLSDVGIRSLIVDIVETLPLFSGAGVVAGVARAGGFGSIAARMGASAKTVEALGRTGSLGKVGMGGAYLFDRSIRTTNLLMATGLTVATANWAASAYSPEYSETLGRQIDASRIVSDSSLAGVVNAGGFLTGFYGIETAVPAWFRAAGKGVGLATRPLGRIERGMSDLSFNRELGGTKLGHLLERDYELDRNLQGTALSAEFLSTYINLRARQRIGDFERVARGESTGIPDIDRIPDLEGRLAAAEALIALEIKNAQGGAAMLLPKVMNRVQDEADLLGGPVSRRARKRRERLARAIDDETTQAMLGRYGERFFPTNEEALRAATQRYLRGLGKSDDLTAIAGWAGKDLTKWKQATRRLHQILFFSRNAELHAAAEGSMEAGRIGMVSQRHLFADEIEDLANVLADSTAPERGQALYRALIQTKDDVQDLEALGAFNTPEELAAVLVQIAPTLPHRRSIGPDSAAGMLNDFQKIVDEEGFWTVGFKPTGTWTLPEGWVRGDITPPAGTTRLAYSPDTLRDMGYRPLGIGEVMHGPEFNRRAPIWPVAEHGGGVWVREVPGETVSGVTAKTAKSFDYYAHDPMDPQHYQLGDGSWEDTSGAVHQYRRLREASFDAGDDVPEMVHGNNPGADWPVLVDRDSFEAFVFKAKYGHPISDLPEHMRLAAPTVTKLAEYLGLRTARETPFKWNGVEGTLQPFIAGDSVSLSQAELGRWADRYGSPADYKPKVIQSLQEHHVLDWLMSQHDSNAGAFLLIGDDVVGVDKGQAFKAFGSDAERAAFVDPTGLSLWTWRGPSLDYTMREALFDLHQKGGVELDRGAIERVLQKIEAIPQSTWEDFLWPLAKAREDALGVPAADFIRDMTKRKDYLREAMNNAYAAVGGIRISRPGAIQRFEPGQHGSYQIDAASAPINAPPMPSHIGDFEEPPPATIITRVGVVLEEADGRLWMLEPANHFDGNMGVWPKGHLESSLDYPVGTPDDEFLRLEALRELREETGFSAELTGHLVDVEVRTDDVVRYYVGRRTGGGPKYADKAETWSIQLGLPNDLTTRLMKVDSVGQLTPNERELDVLKAYMTYKHPKVDPVGTPDAADGMPGDAPDAEEFLSYVKLPSGAVFRSPWLDHPLGHPDLIEMGNRNLFMQKFDDVFRGWRTYRIEQSQRAALHRRLTRIAPGITPARIDRLHDRIVELASEPVVDVGPLRMSLPPQGVVLTQREKLMKAVKDTLGDGPYMGPDGALVEIDWQRELAKAYRTSMRLNLTSGFTSQLYSMGHAGAGAGFIAQLVYPALRFALSPVFKAGELTESWGLNALRGVNPYGGDPFTEALMLQAGALHNRGQLRLELSSEPILQGLTTFSLVDPATSGPKSLLFRTPVPAGVSARARQRMASSEGRDTGSPMRGLYPDPDIVEIYPEQFSDLGIDSIVPHAGVDETGAPILDFDGRANDDAIVLADHEKWIQTEMYDALSKSTDIEADLHDFLAGMAFVESLGPDFIPRLTRAITPVTTSSSSGGDIFDLFRRHFENGTVPFSGAPGRGNSDIVGREGVGDFAATPALKDEYAMPNTGKTEMAMGHIDSYYGGLGEWSDGELVFAMKDSIWKKSVIFDTDRMGVMDLGPSRFARHMLTPSGAYRVISQKVYQALHGYGKRGMTGSGRAGWSESGIDQTDLAGRSIDGLSATQPLEVAIPGGTGMDEVEAIVLRPGQVQKWADLVQTYGDEIPALRDIKIVTVGDQESIGRALSRYWFEKAGLTDRRFQDLAKWRTAPVGAYTHLLPSEDVSPGMARLVIERLSNERYDNPLSSLAGLKSVSRYQTTLNLDDTAEFAMQGAREQLREAKGYWEAAVLQPRGRGASPESMKRQFDEAAARVSEVEDLQRDIKAWRSTAYANAFADISEATAALGTGADTAARAWIAGYKELDVRLHALSVGGQQVNTSEWWRSLPPDLRDKHQSARTSAIHDVQMNERVELPPYEQDTIAAAAEVLSDKQAVAYAQFLMERLKERAPKGTWDFDSHDYVMFDDYGGAGHGSLAASLTPIAFSDELKRLAMAKTGQTEGGLPIVHAWLRARNKTSWNDRQDGELVITVMGPDGQPYGGLRPDEMADAWQRTSMPRTQPTDGDIERAFDANGGRVIYTPDGGPHGSLVFYDMNTPGLQASFETLPDGGHRFVDPALVPERYTPITFLYAFEPRPGDQLFTNLSLQRGYNSWQRRGGDITTTSSYSPFDNATYMNKVIKPSARKRSGEAWAYSWIDLPDVKATRVELGDNAAASHDDAAELFDALLTRFNGDRVSVEVAFNNPYIRHELAARHVRGEIPRDWSIVRRGGGWDDTVAADIYRSVYDDAQFQQDLGVDPAITAMMPDPPPATLDDVVGTPEHLTASLGERFRAKGGEAMDAWWNPLPTKEHQQDKLIMRLVRDWFPDEIRENMPDTYRLLAQELGVPDTEMVTFLAQDRQLLARWLETGDRADFDSLVMHAEQYRPASMKGKAREELDSLYARADWSDVMEVLRMTARGASDEAFQVHFFAPYRSTFERSINHPLLGVYPASWAYKVAKEWWRFLYDNDMLKGFRLGMTPAVWIAQLREQQHVAFAQLGGEDLDVWMEDGPLSSSIFLFNLLMPGDWSALPFPLSRSMRDAIRGNLSPWHHFNSNISQMGLGRDLRLAGELGAEWQKLLADEQPALRRGEERLAPEDIVARR